MSRSFSGSLSRASWVFLISGAACRTEESREFHEFQSAPARPPASNLFYLPRGSYNVPVHRRDRYLVFDDVRAEREFFRDIERECMSGGGGEGGDGHREISAINDGTVLCCVLQDRRISV